jgi:Bleomycin resistance protein-like N-terminal
MIRGRWRRFRDLSIIQAKLLNITATDINLKSTKLHMPSVVHFEIAVDDPERAIKFYSTVFGWKIQKWDQFDYWLASTKHEGEVGIDGALMKREMAEQIFRQGRSWFILPRILCVVTGSVQPKWSCGPYKSKSFNASVPPLVKILKG